MNNLEEAQRLIDKYASGTCTPVEKALVESGFLDHLKRSTEKVNPEQVEAASHKMFSNIHGRIDYRNRWAVKRKLASKVAVAAGLFLVLAAGLFFYQGGRFTEPEANTKYASAIQPGKAKAFLTLADGSKILLGESGTGKLTEQGGTVVSNSLNGQLIYTIREQPSSQQATDNESYNIIETPRGGQYQVILSDNSRVWLNSGSSIRFPVVFSPELRKVEITGEVYFEISKSVHKPFVVISDRQVIRVLGTRFNVNSYSDDGFIKTTLLEGSVQIQSGDETKILKPGEQSLVGAKAGIKTIAQANPEVAIAWKNGDFLFHNAPLVSVIRQLERWYDVKFTDADKLSYQFNGKISRQTSLTKILKMIEITSGIKFKIEGRSVSMIK